MVERSSKSRATPWYARRLQVSRAPGLSSELLAALGPIRITTAALGLEGSPQGESRPGPKGTLAHGLHIRPLACCPQLAPVLSTDRHRTLLRMKRLDLVCERGNARVGGLKRHWLRIPDQLSPRTSGRRSIELLPIQILIRSISYPPESRTRVNTWGLQDLVWVEAS